MQTLKILSKTNYFAKELENVSNDFIYNTTGEHANGL